MTDKKTIFIDFETEADLDLTEVGAGRYASECKPTWVAWATDGEDIEVRRWSDDAQAEFMAAVVSADRVVAHNAVFDLLVLRFCLPPALFKLVVGKTLGCTACMAGYLNLPKSLADLADYFGLPKKKEMDFGKQGNMFVSSTEKDWKAYVAHDVSLLRDIHSSLTVRVPPEERELIDLHLRMQVRGVAVDRERLDELGRAASAEMKGIDDKFKLVTGYTPTQTVRLGEWFRRECGVPSASTKELTQAKAWASDWSDSGKMAYDLLMRRKENELVKLRKVKTQMTADGELVDTLNHASTITNRWSGRGAHLHNFSRDGQARSIIVPHDGKGMVRADLKQIEVRVGLWIAGMKDALTNLHESDWYLDLTKEIYGSDHDADAMKQLRHGVKQGVIGAMYSGGVEAVRRAIGPDATRDQAEFVLAQSKRRMRAAVAKSSELFKAWERAAKAEAGFVCHVAVGVGGAETVIIGRPKVGIRSSDDNIVLVACPRGRLIYRGVRQTSKGDWEYRVGTRPKFMKHPGTLYENICSTIAREVLAAGLLNISKTPNLTPVTTVHDEVLVEVNECLMDKKPECHVKSALTQPVAGLNGLLLNSDVEVRSAWKEC